MSQGWASGVALTTKKSASPGLLKHRRFPCLGVKVWVLGARDEKWSGQRERVEEEGFRVLGFRLRV